jgi:hypothetical protein
VVVEIFKSSDEGIDTLAQQLQERMLDVALISMVSEASGELVGDAEPLVELTNEQEATFIAEVPTAKVSLKFAAS